jgi:acyl-CoA thioesterase I
VRFRSIALAGVLAFGVGGCAASHGAGDAAAAPAQGTVRFLALGDSCTIGTGASPAQSFPARLVSLWACPIQLVNAGVDGFTTDDVIEVELPELASFAPSVVTLLVGANDIVHAESSEVYRAHVRAIFQSVRSAAVPRVIVLPQPDWSLSPVASAFGAPAELHSRIVEFNQILKEETARARGDFVDLFPLMEKEAALKMLASDGLHPSAAAYDAWARSLADVVASPCEVPR